MYLDEFVSGTVYRLDPILVSEEEIIAFARRFDPQRIHIDAEFAENGPFSGLIASGYHTLALAWAGWIRRNILGDESMGGPGLERVQWLAPVRPGDVLRVEVTVGDVRPSKTKPRGTVHFHFEVFNQSGVQVMASDGAALVRIRPT